MDEEREIKNKFHILGQSIEEEYFGKPLKAKERDVKDQFYLNLSLELLFIGLLTFVLPQKLNSLILIDSGFEAIKFVIFYHQLQTNFGITYVGTINRYIYLFMIYFFVISVKFFSWNMIDLTVASFFMLSPHLITVLIKLNPFSGFIEFLYTEAYKTTCYLLAKSLAFIVNTIAKDSLNTDPKIIHQEMEPMAKQLMKDKKAFNHLLGFVKSFLFASLLHYAEISGYSFLIGLYRRFYLPGSKKTSLEKDIRYVRLVIKRRDWKELLDAKTVGIFLRVYIEESKKKQYSIKHHIKVFCLKVFKIYCQIRVDWVFGSLLKFPILGPLMSLAFVPWKEWQTHWFKHLGIALIGLIVSYSTGSPLYGAIISELIDPICFYPLTVRLTKEATFKLINTDLVMSFENVIKSLAVTVYIWLSIQTDYYYYMSILLYPIFRLTQTKFRQNGLWLVLSLSLANSYLSNFHLAHLIGLPFLWHFYLWYFFREKKERRDWSVVTQLGQVENLEISMSI